MIALRAGAMDRVITIQRVTMSFDDFGATVETWSNIFTAHAQLINTTAKEFIRDFGASTETTSIFRTRYLAGLNNADRVCYDGKIYLIKEVTEIGRRRGLELRCVAQP